MKPGERLAVIDLGSNSFRLVVFMAGDGWWKRTDEIYEPVRIGEGLVASGKLGKRADRARDGDARRVRAVLRAPAAWTTTRIDAVATSAIRDADNAEDFLERARERSGCRSACSRARPRPATAIWRRSTRRRSSDGCVLDLGGGSMQLVRRARPRWRAQTGSWRVGTVRMSERFLPANGPAKRKQLDALREHVAEELAQAEWLRPGEDAGDARRIVGIGGTVRNLASAAQRAAGLPTNGVQGMVLGARGARRAGRAPGRAAGGRARERAGDQAGARRPDPRRRGRRAGRAAGRRLRGSGGDRGGAARGRVLRAAARPARGERTPLFDDVRRASVLNLAGQYHFDSAHTRHVATLALGMFDELARLGLHEGDARERELLWAASMLHDIGMSVDYDDHHKHSRYLILNAGLPGFTPVEVAIIAQAARYHRKGMPDPGPLRALFGEGDRERLDRCAVLLRLAEDLERSRDQLVRGTRVEVSDDDRRAAPDRRRRAGWSRAGPPAARRELFARAFDRELAVAA